VIAIFGLTSDFIKDTIMRICTISRLAGLLVVVAVSAMALTLSGCPLQKESNKPAQSAPQTDHAPVTKAPTPSAEKSKTEDRVARRPETADKAEPLTEAEKVAQDVEQAARKPRDLGAPLVDDPSTLQRLDPTAPVWIDKKNRWVVVQGEVCSVGYPLEFFASYATKAYESVLAVNVKAHIIHAGLLTVGAEPGHPAQSDNKSSPPRFIPPAGTEIALEVRWKAADGKVQSADARQWVRNIKTKKALDVNWIFAGSTEVTREDTGEKLYAADGGELICVLSSPYAMLDLPMFGYGAIEARSFEAFKEHMPPKETSVTLLLKPILSTNPSAKAKATVKPAVRPPLPVVKSNPDAEQKAVAAAEPWLALVDKAEYAQAWENSASLWKDKLERREFVKAVGDMRKPLGKMTSRQLDSKQFAMSMDRFPAGQYVVLQYKTTFANKKSANETVVSMLDKDKKWRVLDYFVK
jgi:hypothetical protein